MTKKLPKRSDKWADHRAQFLASLDEDAFRKIVLVPLLIRLNYREVIEYHGGSAEKGKDIICWYSDPMGRRRYMAVVAKKGDIHGSVGKKGNASEVLFQVQQALNEPYRDIYDLKELRIDECIIATTGSIKNTAIESVTGSLRNTNLDRLLSFIDKDRVIDLVTNYMPEYWLEHHLHYGFLHELRGPLSSIAASADLLKHYSDKLDAARYTKIASRIARDAEIAQLLAENQFTFRMQELHVHPSSVVLGPELTKIIESFRLLFGSRRKVAIEFEIKGELGRAVLDLGALRNVMYNVLDNSVKYSHAGRAVEVVATRNGPQIIIRVRNYGLGISPDFEELVFQPFYTASPHGPGLGLYVARKLIFAMGGVIRVTNLNDPTEFSLYFNGDETSDTDS